MAEFDKQYVSSLFEDIADQFSLLPYSEQKVIATSKCMEALFWLEQAVKNIIKED